MNLSTIEQGEELLKRATPGKWSEDSEEGMLAQDVWFEVDGKRCPMTWDNMKLVVWIQNHASELLQMARDVETLKTEMNERDKFLEIIKDQMKSDMSIIAESRERMHRQYPELFKD